jgi:hypothetical protein
MALTQQFTAGERVTAAKLNASSIPVVSSTADITAPFTNQVIYNSAIPGLQRYTGSAWVLFDANTQWIRKPVTESLASSTTLQNDDHFAFSTVANASYALSGYILCDGDPAGDLNCDFTVPAGASFLWTNFANSGPAAGASLTDYNVVAQGGSVARAINLIGAGITGSFKPEGYLDTAGTAGTLQFRWAQNASNATATRIIAGSRMSLTRIG